MGSPSSPVLDSFLQDFVECNKQFLETQIFPVPPLSIHGRVLVIEVGKDGVIYLILAEAVSWVSADMNSFLTP